MNAQVESAVFGCSAKDERALNSFCNQWFNPHCCWKIPNIKETQALDDEALKSLIRKSVIGLRQKMSENDSATKDFDNCSDVLVSAQLDALALKYGYVNARQASSINAKKSQAMEDYKQNQAIFEELNHNLGTRVAASICLIRDDNEKNHRGNLLSIMNLIKHNELAILQGLIKSHLMKFSISMCNELGRTKYESMIRNLEKELRVLSDKVRCALEKLPGGIISKLSLKDSIESELKKFPQTSDAQIGLIHTFDVVAEHFSQVNVAVATKLVKLVIPVEREYKILSISPSNEENSSG